MKQLLFSLLILAAAPSFAWAGPLAGTWSGRYACPAGPSVFELTVTDIAGRPGNYNGVLRFRPDGEAKEPAGAYNLSITHDEARGTVTMVPTGWIEKQGKSDFGVMTARTPAPGEMAEGTMSVWGCGELTASLTAPADAATAETTAPQATAPAATGAAPAGAGETPPKAPAPQQDVAATTTAPAPRSQCPDLDLSDPASIALCVRSGGPRRADPFKRNGADSCDRALRQLERIAGVAPLPGADCAAVAEALVELGEERPFWTACFGYGEGPAEDHAFDCVTETYLKGRPGRDRFATTAQLGRMACLRSKSIYEKGVAAANPRRETPAGVVTTLPEGFAPDCAVFKLLKEFAAAWAEERRQEAERAMREKERRRQEAIERSRKKAAFAAAAAAARKKEQEALNKLVRDQIAAAIKRRREAVHEPGTVDNRLLRDLMVMYIQAGFPEEMLTEAGMRNTDNPNVIQASHGIRSVSGTECAYRENGALARCQAKVTVAWAETMPNFASSAHQMLADAVSGAREENMDVILVHDGERYRLHLTEAQARLILPREAPEAKRPGLECAFLGDWAALAAGC